MKFKKQFLILILNQKVKLYTGIVAGIAAPGTAAKGIAVAVRPGYAAYW
jgi:hypothetical protein